MTSKIAASIVTWNSEKTIAECLDSLLEQSRVLDSIYVYDNASSDATRAVLDRYGPKIVPIYADKNSGFCGGHNALIDCGSSEFLLLVNPDVRLERTYVERSIAAIEQDGRVGTVCGRLLQSGEADQAIVDGTGLLFTRSRRLMLRDHGKVSRLADRPRGEAFGTDGALPLFRRAMIKDISVDGFFFDPTFFAHKEDHDVAWRSRLLGWKTVFEPQCIAYHPRVFRPGDLTVQRRLSTEIKYHAVKNDLLMLLKNEQMRNFWRDFLYIVPRRLAIAIYSLFAERGSLAAYFFVVRNLRAILRQRTDIQQRACSSPAEVRRWIYDGH